MNIKTDKLSKGVEAGLRRILTDTAQRYVGNEGTVYKGDFFSYSNGLIGGLLMTYFVSDVHCDFTTYHLAILNGESKLITGKVLIHNETIKTVALSLIGNEERTIHFDGDIFTQDNLVKYHKFVTQFINEFLTPI